jgi:hypothetical protein
MGTTSESWSKSRFSSPEAQLMNRIPIKGKCKVALCFFFNWTPHYGDVLWEWRYSSTHSITSALDGGEWSVLRPCRFTLRERVPGTHWIGGWVGPRAILNAVVKRKIPSPRRESKARTPIIQPRVYSSVTHTLIILCFFICGHRSCFDVFVIFHFAGYILCDARVTVVT